jgi:hypothetical protein
MYSSAAPGSSSRPSIKPGTPNHLLLFIESQQFNDTAPANALVKYPERVDSHVYVDQLKLNTWNGGKAHRPVPSNGGLASKHSAWIDLSLDDERGGHFEVLNIVRQDSIQIMRIPGLDPFFRKSSGP